jgi:prolyl-tRNA editing enzyme YbaK/EbsC (Cys-tRNA(Pro) deacylase)
VRTAWPEPVERVSTFLRESGVEARIEEFADGTPTATDAAAAVGCELDRIVKSLVFVCDERAVVALVPGDRRADTDKIARIVGASSVRVASRSEVEDATGFAPGAVAPCPLPRVETVLLERELLQHPLVWTGAGSPRYLLGIAPTELLRAARARASDLVAEDAYDSNRRKES